MQYSYRCLLLQCTAVLEEKLWEAGNGKLGFQILLQGSLPSDSPDVTYARL